MHNRKRNILCSSLTTKPHFSPKTRKWIDCSSRGRSLLLGVNGSKCRLNCITISHCCCVMWRSLKYCWEKNLHITWTLCTVREVVMWNTGSLGGNVCIIEWGNFVLFHKDRHSVNRGKENIIMVRSLISDVALGILATQLKFYLVWKN